MKTFELSRVNSILCLGSHSDDIEIGCGGTILKMLEKHPRVDVSWIVLSGEGERGEEAATSAACFLAGAGSTTISVQGFRDGFFPHDGAALKAFFEELKGRINPDIIFTHYRHDLHQDHRLVCELTWNTFRDHMILEYEIPKWDGDLGNPNLYSHLSEEIYNRKIKFIADSFPSQAGKHWFSADTFKAMMRLRGMESNAPSHHAEAFYARKVVL